MTDGRTVHCTSPNGSVPHVHRRILHETLNGTARHRICLIIGAAGWGKSTIAESWAQERRVAWVRQDGHQSDPIRFARSLREALRPHLPTFSETFPEAETFGDGGAGAHAEAVCEWLRKSLSEDIEDIALVVDDLQEIAPDTDSARALEGLCRHAPDRLHLVLISRSEPPFSLVRLRGQGLVAEIHASELAFDVAEVDALLRSTVGAEPLGLAAQLWERSGGWPVAVCQAVEMLREVEPDHRAEVLERLTRPGERLHSYLAEEVIGEVPEPVREVLRRLAVLGQATASSVITSGDADGADSLADLARRGLVRCTPGRVDRWSLVRPLRDYFDHEPALPVGDRARLNRLAAEECTGRGAYADAMRHLLAAGDHAGCAALLLEHGATMVNSGHVEVVLDAVGLPPEHLADPRIQRVLGQARQVRGQWAGARECFERAGDGSDELHPALAWRAGLSAYAQGELDEVLALSDRTGRGNTVDDARLSALVAVASRMVGDYAGCSTETARAVDIARQCGDPSALATGLTALAVLAATDGDRLRADAHFADAQGSAEAAGDLLQVLRLRVLRAFHLVEMGLPRDGLAESETALGLAESFGDPFLTALAHTVRGAANNRLGVLEPALADFAAARDLLQRIGSRFLAWPLCGLGDVHRTRGRPARARAAYEEALALAEPCHEVLGVSAALIGLARIRAADDLPAAHALAERAVALREPLRHVKALLTRGWVALMAEDRKSAAADAARAAAAARVRRDDPGLAEALVLGVLSSDDPARHCAPLAEAIQIWAETGCRIEEAAGRIVAGWTGAASTEGETDLAERTLRAVGVELKSRRVAGPLAVVARATPAVSIRSLGTFQVLREGAPIPNNAWQSKKARDLLKILVTRRRPVSRDHLMELLWPGVEPARSGNRLSVLLSTVRDVLASPPRDTDAMPLVTKGNTVWLDRTRASIDVEEFLSHAGTALEAHRRGQADATDRLLAAESEHTGDFLEEDPYQEWAEPVADEVRATYIALLRAVVFRLRAAGDVERAVRYSLRLLEQDCYDEQAHLDLMQIQLDADHHGEALRRYRIYVRRMTELGIEPRPFPHPVAVLTRTFKGPLGAVTGVPEGVSS